MDSQAETRDEKATRMSQPTSTTECDRDAEHERCMLNAGVPPLYVHASPGDFPDSVMDKADIELSVRGHLFLTGPTGIGKTHLAAAVISNLIWVVPTTWVTIPGLLMDIRATYRDGSEEDERTVTRRYSEIDLLVMDDLGAEKVTDWSLSALYFILSKRIDYKRMTIVTSNMTLSEIHAWEPRIASRLAAFGKVIAGTEDMRLKSCKK